MGAASQLPGRGPTVVDIVPVPAFNQKSDYDDDDDLTLSDLAPSRLYV